MRTTTLAFALASLVGCHHDSSTSTTPATPVSSMTEPAPVQPPPAPEPTAATEPTPAPAPTPPPPAPKQFAAQVELAPVKGATAMKPVTIKLTQEEGKSATMSEVELTGLAPGKYQLVVHESAECGANGTKAGKVWNETAAMPIAIEVTKGTPGKLESADIAVKLEGDQAIVGKTLVLHQDKAGKPGKVLACGAVAKIEMPNEPQAIK